jgi:hypothetical protein
MKALILDGKVVDVQENTFEVHQSMQWVDCDNSVKVGFTYDGSTFTSNLPSAEEVAAAQAAVEAKLAAKASGYQKLIALGLTEAEATALTGYTPE